MSSSRKKKTNKQLKTYLAILASVLAVLVLLALILTLGRYTSEPPVETEPSETIPPETTTEATEFTYDETFPTDPAVDSRLGIDVSEHQKNIDWGQVKAAGVDFVMIRLGYRGYTEGRLYMDSYFAQHYQGAKEAGLDVGVYFFSQALTPEEARAEARFLLTVLGWRDLTMGIAYDWEFVNDNARTAGVDGRTMTDCALAFCEVITDAGHKPWIYFNQFQADYYYILEELSDYDFWFAKYTEELDCPVPIDMWQYTGSGSVPGIDVPVDMNLYWP